MQVKPYSSSTLAFDCALVKKVRQLNQAALSDTLGETRSTDAIAALIERMFRPSFELAMTK